VEEEDVKRLENPKKDLVLKSYLQDPHYLVQEKEGKEGKIRNLLNNGGC